MIHLTDCPLVELTLGNSKVKVRREYQSQPPSANIVCVGGRGGCGKGDGLAGGRVKGQEVGVLLTSLGVVLFSHKVCSSLPAWT